MQMEMMGLIALAAALVILWRHSWSGSRVTVLLMLAGGAGIAAGGGLLSEWLTRAGQWLASLATDATATAVGVGMPALVAVAAAVWVAVDLRDKQIHPATPWVALCLPTLVMVTGAMAVAGDWLSGAGVSW